MWDAIVAGYLVALSLIAAIGAQNAFVLRQGLRREHVAVVVGICALSDGALIALGVGGFGAIAGAAPWFAEAMRWLGVVFLTVYGALRFKAAWAVLFDSTTITIWPMCVASTRDSVVTSSGGESNTMIRSE